MRPEALLRLFRQLFSSSIPIRHVPQAYFHRFVHSPAKLSTTLPAYRSFPADSSATYSENFLCSTVPQYLPETARPHESLPHRVSAYLKTPADGLRHVSEMHFHTVDSRGTSHGCTRFWTSDWRTSALLPRSDMHEDRTTFSGIPAPTFQVPDTAPSPVFSSLPNLYCRTASTWQAGIPVRPFSLHPDLPLADSSLIG